MSAMLGYYVGDDTYGLDACARRLAERVAAETGSPPTRVRVAGGDISVPEIAERIATGTLFGGGTILVVVDPGPLVRNAASRDALAAAFAMLAPGNALAFLEPLEGSTRRPAALVSLGEAVAAAGGEFREIRAPRGDQMVRWIEERARERSLRLGPGAAALLAERVGAFVREGDVDRSSQGQLVVGELEKLGLLRFEDEIRPDDVRVLVPEAIPASIWGFQDAVADRRVAVAAALVDRVVESTPAPVIVTLLHRRIRELIAVHALVEGGSTPPDIGRALRITASFRVQRLMEGARAWTSAELAEALLGLLELDVVVKSGAGEERIRLELALWLADRVARRRR